MLSQRGVEAALVPSSRAIDFSYQHRVSVSPLGKVSRRHSSFLHSFASVMVYKCCAPGCRTGYKSQDSPRDVTLHKFPSQNSPLLKRWLRNIPRDFVPSTNSRLCSIHFTANDFITESIDRRRNAKRPLQKRRLKDDAVPTIFPGVPSYLSRNAPSDRPTTSASIESRCAKENAVTQELIDKLKSEDCVSYLSSLREKFEITHDKPRGFTCLPNEEMDLYVFIRADREPVLEASISVASDMTFNVSHRGEHLDNKTFVPIMTNTERILLLSDFINLLAFVKGIVEGNIPVSTRSKIKTIIQRLESHVSENVDELGLCSKRLLFLCEQLQLSLQDSKQRRYSNETYVNALLWYSASSACYSSILASNTLCLPSIRSLQRITSRIENPESICNDGYLERRSRGLNDYENKVSLIFDEIYISQRLEYSGGQFIGLCGDKNKPAKTILTFMIKSLASKYRDVVALFPVSRINAEILHNCFNAVLDAVTRCGFDVVLTCADNHVVNRSFFMNLCGGTLLPFVEHPLCRDKKLFIMIDPTHNMKNLYNNFERKREFVCPAIGGVKELKPNFNHLVELYNMECSKPLRMAHKLHEKCINPSSIQKTSTKLASSVFHESTSRALRHYSPMTNELWNDTAEFIELMIKLWSIVNVRSPTLGKNKRNPIQNPIMSLSDQQIACLNQISHFLKQWQTSEKRGLSRETFIASIHMCDTIPLLCDYLINDLKFKYVLTGNFQSDSLEARFGWYRQLSGANYYLSVKQILENERAIKIVSLLKYSKLSVVDMKASELSSEKNYTDEDVSLFYNAIDLDFIELDESELDVLYYVSGYVVRSVTRILKITCAKCHEMIVEDDSLKFVDLDRSVIHSELFPFFNEINRGGLMCPSELVFTLCCISYYVFKNIFDDDSLKREFFAKSNQRMFFISLVFSLIEKNPVNRYLLNSCDVCERRNILISKILSCIFNTMCKKIVQEMNSSVSHEPRRKIKKLSSN